MKYQGAVDYDRMDTAKRERLEKKYGKEFWKKESAPNPMKKDVGIVERIVRAKDEKAVNKLLSELEGYEHASSRTVRRAKSAAFKRIGQLRKKGTK